MVLWQSEPRISGRSQLFSLLLYIVLILSLLSAPWPVGYQPLGLLLLAAIVFEYIRQQKKRVSSSFIVKFKADNLLEWDQQEWYISQPARITRYGVLLALKHSDNKKHQRLWLASDSMTEKEWRTLCQLLRESSDYH